MRRSPHVGLWFCLVLILGGVQLASSGLQPLPQAVVPPLSTWRTGEWTVTHPSGVLFRFVYVPRGEFRLGLTQDERNRLAAETSNPLRGHNATLGERIRVQEGFFVLKRELSVRQYKLFDESFTVPMLLDDGAPVRDISHTQAIAFCDWLGQQLGQTVRLPTELEWEYIARGPANLRYPWADETAQYAYCNQVGDRGPRGVDDKSQDISWCGAHDLAGNVSEWCLDLYANGYYQTMTAESGLREHVPSQVKLLQPRKGILGLRSIRGGSFRDQPVNTMAITRRSNNERGGDPTIGFRPILLLSDVRETQE